MHTQTHTIHTHTNIPHSRTHYTYTHTHSHTHHTYTYYIYTPHTHTMLAQTPHTQTTPYTYTTTHMHHAHTQHTHTYHTFMRRQVRFLEDRYWVQKGRESHATIIVKIQYVIYIFAPSTFNSEILFTRLLQSWLENNLSLRVWPDGKWGFKRMSLFHEGLQLTVPEEGSRLHLTHRFQP